MASRLEERWCVRRARRPIVMGADLPRTLEQFQAFVRLAFYAPLPEPQDGRQAAMLDALGTSLWERLHLFQAVVEEEADRFESSLHDLGAERPQEGQDIVDRCQRVEMLLREDPDLDETIKDHHEAMHWIAWSFLRERYGPDPAIESFLGARNRVIEARSA